MIWTIPWSIILAPNSAPVCRAINEGTYFPSADTVSSFSLALDNADSSRYTVDPQLCEQKALYAGCMTAPCEATSDTIAINGSDYRISECACPTFEGPYQVGQFPVPGCTLGNGEAGDNVWSAPALESPCVPLSPVLSMD